MQCIHYCLTRPAVGSVMIGFDNADQVPASMAYLTATAEERDYASVLAASPRMTYYGQCTYCGHCQPCPAGLDVAMTNKLYDLATAHATPPATVREHYNALQVKASACLHCGKCETRCPFHVRVSDRMSKIAELFES